MTGKIADLDEEFQGLLDRGKTGVCRFCQLPDDLYGFIQGKYESGFRTWRAYSTLLERHNVKMTSSAIGAHFESTHYKNGERHAG